MNMINNMIEDIDTASFMEKVLRVKKYWSNSWLLSSWCEPCKQITPILEKAIQKHNGS